MSTNQAKSTCSTWAPIGALLVGALFVVWDSLAKKPSWILGSWG